MFRLSNGLFAEICLIGIIQSFCIASQDLEIFGTFLKFFQQRAVLRIMDVHFDVSVEEIFPRFIVNRTRFEFHKIDLSFGKNLQGFIQAPWLIADGEDQGRFVLGDVEELTGRNDDEAGVIPGTRFNPFLQHGHAIEFSSLPARDGSFGFVVVFLDPQHGRCGVLTSHEIPVGVAFQKLLALLKHLRVRIDSFDIIERRVRMTDEVVFDPQGQFSRQYGDRIREAGRSSRECCP